MDTHENAPLTPKGREAMVRSVIEGGDARVNRNLRWTKRFRSNGSFMAAVS